MSAQRSTPPYSRGAVLVCAALAGAATVTGFAPWYAFALPVLALIFLIVIWRRAASAYEAGLAGFAFGLGFFLAGVSWVYVSMHDYGAMPAPLAGVLTFVFCAYLALFPAFTGWAFRRLHAHSAGGALLALPALWTLTEWLRGWLFTGFPWLALGYAQVPASPLAGYLPLLGVYGATFTTAVSAALAVAGSTAVLPQLLRQPVPSKLLLILKHPAPWIFAVLWLVGAALLRIEWTQPEGAPLTVSLLQGDIPQEMKWREGAMRSTLATYQRLAAASAARLIVLPETALPLFLDEAPPDYLAQLATHARNNGGDILLGIPERIAGRGYYNSVISLGSAPPQAYRKNHLVPFGEFVPLKPLFGWFFEVADIPLLDFSRGTTTPEPLAVAGARIAVNICYEDAFGAEIIRQLPGATLLVNVSNVAWFGRSVAPRQHLQISQARALETGRYMLRATNSGMTAIIDAHGRIQAVAPEFETATVNGTAQDYGGATPYVRWGDTPVIALAVLCLIAALWLAARGTSKIRGLRIS